MTPSVALIVLDFEPAQKMRLSLLGVTLMTWPVSLNVAGRFTRKVGVQLSAFITLSMVWATWGW